MIAKNIIRIFLFITTSLLVVSCKDQNKNELASSDVQEEKPENIIVGANRTDQYLDLLKHKKVGLVGNHTTILLKRNSNDYMHLVDSLLSLDINITKVFAPEHGFRGKADAGESIQNGIDEPTGLPMVSLYGKNDNTSTDNFKPTSEQLKDIELMVFDIQDVGVRFYTYLSTMHYIMEACAENDIPVIVLDRPNPNGHYIDGPIAEKEFKSFVGLHPVPIVYGMTIGEYAKMVNGEKWLKDGVTCDLTVIPLENYTHQSTYSLPLRPSPNLPNDKSINLYASLCLFEGTNVNCGRGTEMQFQIFGSPDLPGDTYEFSFTPQPNFGSKKPKNMGKECHGLDLSKTERLSSLNFNWLIDAYHATSDKENFFRTKSFNLLAGSDKLREQLENGLDFEAIKESWQEDLKAFKSIREKYLIYP